jgi:autotransporter-associated beta strand protein
MANSFSTFSNWASDATGASANGVVPGGNAVNVIFGATGATEQANVTTGANMNLGSITFNDAAAVTLGGSHTITLNSTSGTLPAPAGANQAVTAGSAIAVTTHANATNTIGANILLGASQTWNVATGKTLAVSGTVSGTFNLTKASPGALVLSGGNSYTGTTTVSAGTLVADHATALGTTGAITIVSNGATLDVRANIGTEPISVTGTGVGAAGALVTGNTFTGTVGGTVTLTGATSIGGAGTGTLNINGMVRTGGNPLTTLGTGVTTFGSASDLTSVASLAVTDGTTNVNSALGNAGNAVVTVSDIGGGPATKLRFGSVSQTLTSLTIGAGATVVFTSGAASGSLTGDDGGGKAAGFGSPASSFGGGATVPEPGTLGLLLVGALGMLNRRRRA